MDEWDAGRTDSDLEEMNEKGFLQRFMKLLGRKPSHPMDLSGPGWYNSFCLIEAPVPAADFFLY